MHVISQHSLPYFLQIAEQRVIVEKSDLVRGNVLEDSLNSVLNDPKYRTAALRMKNLLGHRPFTPQQKLVKTVELAAQFGDMPELKVSGRKLGFVVYYNLDVLAMLFAIFALMTFVPLYLLYRCSRGRFSDSKLKTQ
nr:Protein UGT-23, isoform a [Haemonchus contortus]